MGPSVSTVTQTIVAARDRHPTPRLRQLTQRTLNRNSWFIKSQPPHRPCPQTAFSSSKKWRQWNVEARAERTHAWLSNVRRLFEESEMELTSSWWSWTVPIGSGRRRGGDAPAWRAPSSCAPPCAFSAWWCCWRWRCTGAAAGPGARMTPRGSSSRWPCLRWRL